MIDQTEASMDSLIYALLKILINLLLLMVWIREAGVVRGDGQSGFVEVVGKSLITLLSIIFIVMSAVSLAIASTKTTKANFKKPIDLFVTGWLLFFVALSVYSACADATGYCQHWSLF